MTNKGNRFLNYLNTLFARWGGRYISRAISFTVTTSALAALISVLNITTTISLSPDKVNHLLKSIVVTVIIANTFAFWIGQTQTKNLRKLLALRSSGEETEDKSLELKAWKELTSLPRRFVFVAASATLFIVTIPVVIYMARFAGATENEVVHIFLAGLLAIALITMTYLIILRILLTPVRQALQPQSFDSQLAGLSGLSIRANMRLLSIAIISIALISIASHGYQEAIDAMDIAGAGRVEIIQLRWQLISVAMVAVVIGIALADAFASTLYQPVERLRQAMEEVAEGNLSKRSETMSTDEIGALSIYFNQMVAQLKSLQEGLESQISQQTNLLRTATEVGHVASSILDPDLLITNVVDLITERLDYYYASIFIISPDGSWAELRGATGEAGRELKEKKHRLALSGQNMVGSAINLREARIAHDVGLEAVRFNNPLLPHTRSEIALPLMAGGHVLGALDVQSTRENAFNEDVTETLQGMANQVAVALENARLFQETQQALKEIQASQKIQLSKAWTEILDSEGDLKFSVGEKTPSNDLMLNIPLALRDQVIGEITLEGNPDWGAEDQDWIEAVATQAAIALENARLLEDSQQVALQERLVAEITSKIWASNSIDGILKVAIKELGNALGATEALVELNISEKQETR